MTQATLKAGANHQDPLALKILEQLGAHPRKHLDEDDISAVLESLECVHPAAGTVDRVKLRSAINEEVHATNCVHALLVDRTPIHERATELSKVQNALVRAQEAIKFGGPWPLATSPLLNRLALEADKLAGRCEPATIESWRAMASTAFPDSDLISGFFAEHFHAEGVCLPSDEAAAQVLQAVNGLDLLVHLMGLLLATLREKQGKLTKLPDYARYELILELVPIFELFFHQAATITREGACCTFLAAVLTRCEGKQIDPAGAWAAWRKARRWSRESGD